MHSAYIYDFLMVAIFIIGYLLITVEHKIHVNKTGISLLMAALCWICLFLKMGHSGQNHEAIGKCLDDVSQVVFFLLGALAIVETINAHKGFNFITKYINFESRYTLLWVVGLITFFLSGILDNLTTTIVMVTLIRKLVQKGEDRLLMGGAIVVAANAGGAWTPIGDITTTMLWIKGQISAHAIMKDLFLPSIICMAIAFLIIGFFLKEKRASVADIAQDPVEPMGMSVFFLGIGTLVFVPIFKLLTGLPPYMGILFGLALMWIFTDIVHNKDERSHLRLPYILSKADISSILFFLGILLTIGALDAATILEDGAKWIGSKIENPHNVAIILGLLSAVVDNVPLVAAIIGMYNLGDFPTDSSFWQLVSFCAGTGGSILVIGSAAGVAFMGMEKVDFFWYLRKVGLAALVGYFVGIGFYLLFW